MRQLYFGFCISCLYFLHMINNGFGVMSYSKPRASCIQFADLWKNAETGNPASEYKYQCAIRLSITLHNVGIDMKSFS